MISLRAYFNVQLLLVLLVLTFLGKSGANINCYSCSYNFAGHDGTYGYDCVDQPINFTMTSKLACAAPSQCIISTTYTEGFETLWSSSRGCRKPSPDLTNGCLTVSSRPSCEFTCSDELCNDLDGDLYKKYAPNSAPKSVKLLWGYVVIFVTFLSLL